MGRDTPQSIEVDTFQSGRISDADIGNRLRERLDLSPYAIAARFAMRERTGTTEQPGFFEALAVFGQIGRTELDLPWEQTDVTAELAR